MFLHRLNILPSILGIRSYNFLKSGNFFENLPLLLIDWDKNMNTLAPVKQFKRVKNHTRLRENKPNIEMQGSMTVFV